MYPLILASLALAADQTFAVEAFWYTDPVSAPYVYYESTMTVPDLPSIDWQTTFIWPGLQPLPSSPHFLPINEGVLQAVLTYGTSCSMQSSDMGVIDTSKWWISAQYVNTYGPAFICTGGNAMNVNPGEQLKMVISLPTGSTIWQQTIYNLNSGKTVSFSYDLQGQEQAWAMFIIELANGWHNSPPQFQVTNIVLKTPPGTVNSCTFSPSAFSGYAGASVTCNDPVRNGNVCTVAKCWIDSPTGSTGGVVGSACSNTAYAQCGGAGFTGSTCCPSGYTCNYSSQWWSSCTLSTSNNVPAVTTTVPAVVQATKTAPVQTTQNSNTQPTQSGTVAPWGQCGGTGYTGSTVCQSGYQCTYSSAWWSSCAPN
ncbi:hypothetical protein HDV01_002367 [Terramyces sp. JEL0728]|nr:hypothetical protein HDV01_002367 [Terramyces sp. JEL0728]